MPAMRYGISFAHLACFTGDNSFTKAPAIVGSKQQGTAHIRFDPPSTKRVCPVTKSEAFEARKMAIPT